MKIINLFVLTIFVLYCHKSFPDRLALECDFVKDEQEVSNVQAYLNAKNHAACHSARGGLAFDLFYSDFLLVEKFNLCYLKSYEIYEIPDDLGGSHLKNILAREYYLRSGRDGCPKVENPVFSDFVFGHNVDAQIVDQMLEAVSKLFEGNSSIKKRLIWWWKRTDTYNSFMKLAMAKNPHRVRRIYFDGKSFETVINVSDVNWAITIKGDLDGDWKLDAVAITSD